MNLSMQCFGKYLRGLSGGLLLLLVAACGEEEAKQPKEKIIPVAGIKMDKSKYDVVTKDTVAQGELWTNLHDGPQPEVVRVPIDRAIYDVAYVVYSREFADRYGFPDTHVANLDEGIHLVEFRMKSRGSRTGCRFNVFIEDTLDHFLRDQETFHYFLQAGNHPASVPVRLPPRVPDFEERPEDYDFRMNNSAYSGPDDESKIAFRTIFLTGQPHYPDDERGGSSVSLVLRDYHSKMLLDLDYFSIGFGCSQLPTRIIKQPGSSLLIKKFGGADLTRRHGVDEEDFLIFRIPEELKEKFSAVLTAVANMMEGDLRRITEARFEYWGQYDQ